MKLVGTFHLPLVPDGLPVDGQMQGTFEFRRLRNGSMLSSSGSTIAANCWSPAGEVEPILDLPWRSPGADHHQRRPLAHPLRGVSAARAGGAVGGNWQQGTEQMIVSGRLNVLTEGMPGRAMRY